MTSTQPTGYDAEGNLINPARCAGMTEQDKREKVIKGLAACMPLTKTEATFGCGGCPYQGYGDCMERSVSIPVKLIEDARALLKAEAPHVLTWEELWDWRPFVLWAEDKFTSAQVFQVAYFDGGYRDCAMDWCADKSPENQDDYGKSYRLWTSRPTDEQREAVPWA